MILASAGSGKTFALTNRFIALLAAGAAPERIVALTFTRKAAGEFFDGILGKLAEAAADEREAARLAAEIRRPELRAEDFLRLLRAMTEALHQLRLGTLDSFFAHIARAFPFELGLDGDFAVLETHAARVERRRVLQQLFARSGDLADEQREFLEAFKRATFGTEEKQLARRMDGFLDEHYETFLAAPDAEAWGNPRRIWPDAQPWLAEPRDLAGAKNALRRWIEQAGLGDKQRERWEKFLAAVELWAPGAPLAREVTYVLEKALAEWHRLCEGAAELEFDRKKQTLSLEACAALGEIVRHLAGGELRRRIETTRGVHAVLARYDAIYDALVRRAGKLTFADVERLLRPNGEARRLSFGASEDGRLMLDYRLDAAIDHWLLDEFQDTSRGQWSVLQNLIDEVVQDPEARRTFFCVGDVKQSIYGWREGDPTLMGDIRRHYNGGDAAAAPIETEPLDASWRSGPVIVEMVNATFGAHEAIAGLFPGRASAEWKKNWRTHTTERRERAGQAALLHATDAEDRARQTLAILQEIDPLARGLTCAVLVRRNGEATALADFLRREGGIPAIAESDLCVCTDNPLGAALLALVQAAAHPGDTLAWEHVQMTPLAAALTRDGVATREAVTRGVLARIAEEGFERFAEHWIARLALAGEFATERARQFAAAAAAFDATGSRDPDEFIQFMSRYTLREPESAAVVRVMTVHKSKGLGFDVVVVPELQGNKLNAARDGLAVHRSAQHEVEWVLELPPGWLAREDEALRAHVEAAENDACYEALSLLYVAMTRAKRALFVITEPPGAKSTSNNFPKLLAETLGAEARSVRVGAREFSGPWSAGDPEWFARIVPPAAEPAREEIAIVGAPAAPRRVARRPSGERAGEASAARLFALREGDALEFGRAVHALLAAVEWGEASAIEALARGWQAAGAGERAIDVAVGCLRARALGEVWRRPAGDGAARGEVWRERAFEIVLDGVWVTGVFDRVVIARDASGRAGAATVFDFKTDALTGDAAELERAVARHAAQLQLYRRVVARLTGLAERSVGAELVFTALAMRRAV
ncbi:MAG: UvrD-helicase domain-containing protein [Opitutae bacterium]|nr:UvrD-helicase domain-containing protein [Opitutae bacterium]